MPRHGTYIRKSNLCPSTVGISSTGTTRNTQNFCNRIIRWPTAGLSRCWYLTAQYLLAHLPAHVRYGVRFDRPPNPTESWETRWAARQRADWQALADTYGFHYVVAPEALGLDLPVVLEHQGEALYEAGRP